jgi:uncharacterized membrane protein
MEYRILFSYFFTLPFLVVLDLAYQLQFGLLSAETNWYALSAFYIVYSLGLYYFAIYHGFSRQSLPIALLSGAAFGFFMYATYGLSTMAVLPELPLSVIFLDMVRGAVLSGVVATIGFFINRAVVSA